MKKSFPTQNGFTLIELSIVLVIIGLIVGGVLVGQDLIKASQVRATISQVEKYNTAVNTFYGKYGYLPGDMPATPAAQYGFSARGTNEGQGDGNGILKGYSGGVASTHAYCQGEMITFWVDLSKATLVDGGFTLGSETSNAPNTSWTTSPTLAAYFPTAKLGNNTIVYATNGSDDSMAVIGSRNYFGLAAVPDLGVTTACQLTIQPGFTVMQASTIDSKMDDGLPGTGNVFVIRQLNPLTYTSTVSSPPLAGSATTCFDNNNVTAPFKYSITQNNGNNVNCILNFRMQGGG